MKGIIELRVEVDYAEIVKSENLQGIHAFTGLSSVEDIMNAHLNQIAKRLTESVDGLPSVKFAIRGDIVTSEREDITGEIEETPEEVQEKSVLDCLAEDLQDKVSQLGIPERIIVNDDTYALIKGHENESDDTAGYYMGFPLEREGMDSPYLIVYKPYDGESDVVYFDPLQENF